MVLFRVNHISKLCFMNHQDPVLSTLAFSHFYASLTQVHNTFGLDVQLCISMYIQPGENRFGVSQPFWTLLSCPTNLKQLLLANSSCEHMVLYFC